MRIAHFTAPLRALSVRSTGVPAPCLRGAFGIAVRAILVGMIVLGAAAFAKAAGLPTEQLTVETAAGPQSFTVEIAATEADRATGLMNRKEMAADAGMLFVFPDSGEKFFWMKNTYISLDMIFIDETGRIVSIARDTEPLSEKIVSSDGSARYVLEVIAGTSARLQFAPGQKVSAPSIRP
ncbi:DUF192 domain-containing protein [Pannonibacter phragmitetus]|uniref:DUF192 domain-containing protein n=1 Tax=Pannonibacter phragmitetus TaxID=121719 RepID=UPI001FFCC0EC|nr:DUF192 domain-containing protein [Pannonibacter phragmitetus]